MFSPTIFSPAVLSLKAEKTRMYESDTYEIEYIFCRIAPILVDDGFSRRRKNNLCRGQRVARTLSLDECEPHDVRIKQTQETLTARLISSPELELNVWGLMTASGSVCRTTL